MEHYERLAAAQEKGDPTAVDAAMKTLETQLKRCAKDICEKYINPPKTTDFALMFLPSEGLYAEAIRRVRSEEHTSELQSHSDLVCRLLLEKKKQKIIKIKNQI